MSFENIAQQAIYGALNGQLSCTVFDTAPFLPEAAPGTSFPYCVIGDDELRPWDNDSDVGVAVTVTLHFWARGEGMAVLKRLMGEAYNLLHRQLATGSGAPIAGWIEGGSTRYNIVDCLWQFSHAMTDPDGVTKHGVQRYMLTIQRV